MSGIHAMLIQSSVTIINPLGFNSLTFDDSPGSGGSASSFLAIQSDGTWGVTTSAGGSIDFGNWATPTTVGIGNNYWVKFTLGLNGGAVPNTTITPSATTGWLSLSSTQSCGVTATDLIVSRSTFADFTIEIASDSSGTNIVSTSTITLSVTSTP